MMMSIFTPFQLLELNIISAQDLAPISRHMKTYAVAWVHAKRKLTTRVDHTGGANPTWNDKFVFRVNEEFLYADTSAVMIEIYGLHWFRDVHVGTVRVLISNLIPPNQRPGYRKSKENRHAPPPGMRFLALQVRRASGRPQGILNIGVGLLDGSMRSMPLYTHMNSSAVGHRDLLGEEDPHLQHLNLNSLKTTSSKNPLSPTSKQLPWVVSRPEFRRSKSDTSSIMVSDLVSRVERSRASKKPAGDLISESDTASTTSGDDATPDVFKENNYPPSKMPIKRFESIDWEIPCPPRKVIPEMPCSPAEEKRKTPERTLNEKAVTKDYNRGGESPYLSSKRGTPLRSNIVGSTPIRSNYMPTPIKSHMEFGTPMRTNIARRPIMTESELGPSPSEVVAQMAKESSAAADAESSIINEWTIDDSTVEDLRKKLEHWRTELPPHYDLGPTRLRSDVGSAGPSVPVVARGGRSSRHKTPVVKKHHRRGHTDGGGGGGGNGLFSCFSSICGVECSIVCCGSDQNGLTSKKKKKNGNGRSLHRATSVGNLSYL